MKILALIVCITTLAHGKVVPSYNTAYGYLKNSIIPAEKVQELEQGIISGEQRIVGGVPAAYGQYPYQAGLLIDIVGSTGRGVCGGSLISSDRVATAAHCWHDGQMQAWRFTVVLGSITLFTDGIRITSSAVVSHPNWFPTLARNDVAVIYLPNAIAPSNTISPIALPSGSELLEDFAGSTAIASGFGLTNDAVSIPTTQVLSHVSLNVITNRVCSAAFPFILQQNNLCTSGIGGVGTCSGDSGGPLVVTRNNRRILIGVTSFGSALGCDANLPAAFARVTSFIDFFNQHIN